MSEKGKIRKKVPVVKLGLNLDGISENDLEKLAVKVSEKLVNALDELIDRQSYYVSTVELEFDKEGKTINANIEIDVSMITQPSPELIAKIDTIIDKCFEALRYELVKKFKNN